MPLAIESNDVGFSQRAGTSALLQALRSGRSTLFVASDAPLGKPASAQELSYGAGAAAFALGAERVIARLLGSGSVTAPFVDHFRASQSRYDYFWEERWIRDEGYAKLAPAAIKAALATAGIAISDIAHFIMPSLQRGAADATAKRIGFRSEESRVGKECVSTCRSRGSAYEMLISAWSSDVCSSDLLGSGSVTAPFVDHFRASQSRYDYFWEERWIRDEGYAKLAPAAIKAALATAGIAISDIAHFIMPSLQRGAADATAKRIGFEGAAASGLEHDVGYAGAAHAPLMLAHVLA